MGSGWVGLRVKGVLTSQLLSLGTGRPWEGQSLQGQQDVKAQA